MTDVLLNQLFFTLNYITETVELSNKENLGKNPIVQKDYFHSQF